MYSRKETVTLNIADLKPHPKNPKKHNDALIEKSLSELGYAENIVVDEHGVILSGHGRIAALQKLGKSEVEATRITGWTEAEKEKYLLLANQSTILGGFDDVKLKDFADEILLDAGFVLKGEEESQYTKKIVSPVYTPTGRAVTLSDLFEPERTEQLLEKIQALDVDAPLKSFLTHAAYRFTTFHFQNIAEFYANVQDEQVKEIMLEMALVIIDFQKAIETGYVVLQDEILEIVEEEGYEK